MDKISRCDEETMSQDIIANNVARLKTLFPEAVIEGAIDFGVLQQLLGVNATGTGTSGSIGPMGTEETWTTAGAKATIEEKYGLHWKGKRRVRDIALSQSIATLRPSKADSVAWDTTKNLVIEGDNLEVLKLLQKSYAGKIKLIYIDPPYNTGRDLVYPDDFRDNIKNYRMLTGQIDSDGRKLTSNMENSGRYHTDWLNMMYPRLRLARTLLSDDGVMCISINDVELDKLKMLASEVFGEENFLTLISLVCATTASYRSINVCPVNVAEYLLVYRKSDAVRVNPVYTPTDYTEDYSHLITNYDRPSEEWELKTLDDVVYEKEGMSNWREYRDKHGFNWKDVRFQQKKEIAFREKHRVVSLNTLQKPSAVVTDTIAKSKLKRNQVFTVWREGASPVHVYNGRTLAFFGAKFREIDGMSVPCEILTNVWNDISYLGLGKEGGVPFPNGKKPLRLIRRLLELYTEPESITLDFFAGSGTTGHAVMEQNLADGGNRRFILVQLPEPLDPSNRDQRISAEYCDSLGKPRSIAELTKERLRLASAEILEIRQEYDGDLGFRVFRLDESNIRAWEPRVDDLEQALLEHVEHVLPDRNEDDILVELMVKLGLDLSVPIDTRMINGRRVYRAGEGALFACLDEHISRQDVPSLALAIVEWYQARHPEGASTCVFRDSAFGDDVAKANLSETLKRYGLKNVRSL